MPRIVRAQVHPAQFARQSGKNVDRLTRWFVTDVAPVPQQVLDAYVGTHAASDPNALAAFLAAERSGEEALEALGAHMWIISATT